MKRNEMQHYGELLTEVKSRIRQAQTRAVLAVNAELVHLYWDIGRLIAHRQQQEGWGAGVIPRLARDLHNELPEMKGFSDRNIKLMVQFAREYPNAFPAASPIGQPAVAQLPSAEIGQLPVAQIPWAHNACSCNGSRRNRPAFSTCEPRWKTDGAEIPWR
jgi:hypothetical protein